MDKIANREQEKAVQKEFLVKMALMIGIAGGIDGTLLIAELYNELGSVDEKGLAEIVSTGHKNGIGMISIFASFFFKDTVAEIEKIVSNPACQGLPVTKAKRVAKLLADRIRTGFNVQGGLCVDGLETWL